MLGHKSVGADFSSRIRANLGHRRVQDEFEWSHVTDGLESPAVPHCTVASGPAVFSE